MITIKKRIEELRREIERHNDLYYNEDSPEITDGEYDAMMRELRKLEAEFPEYESEDSPSQRVGGLAGAAFAPVKHKVKMLSLNDVFLLRHEAGSKEESIERFIDGAAKTENTREAKGIRGKVGEKAEFVVEPKIDGVSVCLEYINGRFVRGATRGNGEIGEDVTHNLRVIEDVPKKLAEKVEYLAVRGEVYLSHENFAKLGGSFANPRNAAAGSIRQKDSSQAEERGLSFIAFNVQQVKGAEIGTHWEALRFLERMGFKIPPECELLGDTEAIIRKIESLDIRRKEFGFDMDGAVVKLNDFTQREILGATSKFPLWAVAFKYPAEQAETRLREITLQIGRTGVLTPNAVFDEISLAGTKVSRATLHNMDMIAKKDIRVGDAIIVQKAGEIIPEVVRVIAEKRDGSEVAYEVPRACPFCGGEVARDEEEVAMRCVNVECRERKVREFMHFVSRDAMDIEGMGESVIRRMLESGKVRNFADLYGLSVRDIEEMQDNPKYEEQVNMFGEVDIQASKSTWNLVEAIEKSKSAGLGRLLYALGIRNLGLNAAKLLAAEFGDMDRLIAASEEAVKAIKGVKDAVYTALKEFFAGNAELVDELRASGIVMKI